MKITALVFLFLFTSQHVYAAFPIEHWVVIMMENRSFDHLLGFLKRDKNQEIDGLNGDETNPYNPLDPKSPTVRVTSTASYVDPDAGHSYDSTLVQIFGSHNNTNVKVPPMNGFVFDAERKQSGWGPQIMSMFNYSSLGVLSTLALEYGIIDRWYSSMPGPTEPNRAFLQSCSSNGYIDNNEFELGIGFPQRTMMAALSDAGYSWNVYFDVFPTALFMRELRGYPSHFHGTSQYLDDCKTGKLPTYSFLEPLYFSYPGSGPASDQHPDHNIEDGELFIKTMYEALRASPLWEKSAMIITYDEHGGYYDHSPTPLEGVPNPDGINSGSPSNFKFDRLGVRVPTVIVSPWVKQGTVVHEPNGPTPTSRFEHCSIAATLKKVLNVPKLPLNKRDAWAGTFETMFTNLTSPRSDCPMKLPDPPGPFRVTAETLYNLPLNDLQKGMIKIAHKLVNSDQDVSLLATEQEGAHYAKTQVEKFLAWKKAEILQSN